MTSNDDRSGNLSAKLKRRPSGIRQWPEDERPRERLLSRGSHTLTDAELLAILLRVGVQRSDRKSVV